MNWSAIGWILGITWMSLSGALAIPLLLAAVRAEPLQSFALAAGAGFLPGLGLVLWSRRADKRIRHRDAFLSVSLVWTSACAIGAIPFGLHPGLQLQPVDALFESVSGFTTTGSTVLSNLDTLPHSLLLWRSITQWLGGMGMVVLGVAVLPLLGLGGMQLYKAEAPGPTKDKLTPRIVETAKLLWMLYLGLTATAGVVFYWDGMSPFDAINHAMTAVSTGGFSTHDESLAYFQSDLIYAVTTLAMLAGGASFAVLRQLLTGGIVWREQPELRTYIGIFGLATAVMAVDLLVSMPDTFSTPISALRHASFQAASILTTTGYATMDFDRWPAVSHVVLLALFLVGGMAGLTAGGPKVVRLLLLWKVAMQQFSRLLRPREIGVVHLGSRTIDERALVGSVAFVLTWLLLLVVGTVALSSVGGDVVSSFSAAAVCLGNIGPGFGAVGPAHTFASFDAGSKLVMQALMLLGRLEIYTLLVVMTPGFWRF